MAFFFSDLKEKLTVKRVKQSMTVPANTVKGIQVGVPDGIKPADMVPVSIRQCIVTSATINRTWVGAGELVKNGVGYPRAYVLETNNQSTSALYLQVYNSDQSNEATVYIDAIYLLLPDKNI